MLQRISFFTFFVCLSLVVGCAHLPIESDDVLSPESAALPAPEADRVETVAEPPPVIEKVGIYHKVYRGETLWRIAKAYNVSVDSIVGVNNIPNVAQLEENQLVFIPEATEVRTIVVDTQESKDDFIWPVKGKVIGYFGSFNGARPNKGVDIKTDPGETVRAARSGRIAFADFLPGHGFTVIIDHEDGFYSVYARNHRLLINLNDYVLKNDPIAHVGEKNKLAYLHFEIRKKSQESNPLHYLP